MPPQPLTTPRRTSRMLGAFLATLALFAVVAQVAAAGVPKDFYGVVPQTSLTATDFERLGTGKVGTLRIPIFWSAVDGAAPAGGYDFSTIDPIVGGAAQQGVEVLPFLFGTPAWVAKDLDKANCTTCESFAPTSAAALAAWSGFVGATVARYGEGGTFWAANPTIPEQPIDTWQIWNEQNSKVFFAPKADPKLYAALLDAASTAVKARDPGADVVLGGMPQLGGSRKATPGSKYLRLLYKVSGVKDDFDGVAVHPYGAKIKAVIEQVELFRDEIEKGGDRGAGLYITETGWGSASGGNPLNVGTKGQAQRLKQAFSYFRKNRNKLNIETVNWYSYMDSTPALCDWCGTSGLFTSKGKEKASWKAFTKFTGGK